MRAEIDFSSMIKLSGVTKPQNELRLRLSVLNFKFILGVSNGYSH